MTFTDVLIGTFTEGPQGRGEGIYRCNLDLATGAFGVPTCAVSARNPAYVVAGPGRFVYAAQEHGDADVPGVMAYRRTADAVQSLGGQPVSGAGCCHLAVSADGRLLATAQYQSGHVDLFSLAADGSIGPHLASYQGQRHGPNAGRQEGPHAHCAAFLNDTAELAVVDLGGDSVTVFALGPDARRRGASALDVETSVRIDLPPGSGPRHLSAAPDGMSFAVLCELDESVHFFERVPAGWQSIQVLQAFARPKGGDGAAAAIRACPNDILYASSRTDDLVACLALENGDWTVRHRISSGGAHPRDIAVTPCRRFLIVANQFDDCITSFAIDRVTGSLTPTGHSAVVPSPACLLFQTFIV